ncbi:cell division protein FtsI (penicillin-binding protein 3) [Andreprevotia lacus DSM 23236]|jgi:cell division protein FtsI (penicillin-binding protein 3)|uniref:Peptidoglycan D,D-transpeptidase FtsI n=1 Tax=Andreprevotia lacus DSM 23236 TaxID=1121001 RepID=A0A1W1XS49_9NEIS|nr:penicillin-binding protein 2 [Andreprevotia lacus]SMC26675.1 cell division protein FtsI (penicillin-binding protein 3) [Andreprevotia lacus DSM 23236]
MKRVSTAPQGRQRYVQQLKLERWRVWFMVAALVALFGALLARGLYLQVYNEGFLQEQGDARYTRTLRLEADRGKITDRNGEPLAISTPVQSIWASPRGITLLPPGQKRDPDWEPKSDKDPVPVSRDDIARLSKVLGVSADDIVKKLSESRKNDKGEDIRSDFTWLKRHMSPDDAKGVIALGIPGIYSQTEYRRFYPAGEVMAHIVGYTDIDGKGQEGFELTRNAMLEGKAGSRTVIRDRRGYIVEDISTIVPPRDGETLTLSIDSRIQYLAYRELKAQVDAFHAVGGGIVVLDARTGEVLALANAPSYNPNSRSRIDPSKKRNRALTDLYEPGSTMKPFTIGAAMQAGTIRDTTVFATAGQMPMAGYVIKDTHNYGALTPEGILVKSSNIGAAKVALSMPRETQYNMLTSVGFGSQPQTGFPGEAAGKLRPWKTWYPIEQATIGYGYGISVSLMQMAKAYQIYATDGQIRPITFTKQVAPMPGKQVIPPELAQEIRGMLEKVTQPGGTATRAQVVGYRVAGKTGTARKQAAGGYGEKKYVASFVGFAPASDPRLIIAVMIDEPATDKSIYGGMVSAPVFANVVAGSLRLLGVPPDAPTTNILLPNKEEDEDVKEET